MAARPTRWTGPAVLREAPDINAGSRIFMQSWKAVADQVRLPGRTDAEVSVGPDADVERFAQVVKDHLERFGSRDELDVVRDG